MGPLITVVILFVLTTLFFTYLFVFGTYLLAAYDRALTRDSKLQPGYEDTETWPTRWERRRAFWLEVLTIFISVWLFPLGWLLPHPWKVKSGGSRPILLVHGYKHNQTAWLWLRRRLKKAGLGPIYSLNLKGSRGPIQRYAEQVDALAQKIAKETGHSHLVLIGHSMGGLVSSFYAEYLAPPGTVTHVITLCSPLHGTRSASLIAAACGRQMRPGSHLTKDLAKRIEANQNIRYCHLTSQLDNIIFPHQSGLIGADGAHQRVLPAHGHNTVLFSPIVANQVIDWLREPARIPPAVRVHNPDAILLPT
jgi:pimeloyl-ACP methyl ester carboxylesterase